jgi:soluble lytic murein transglycosylase-like protein
MMRVSFEPRGPEAIRQRIAEIQSRMEALSDRTGFAQALDEAQAPPPDGALSGPIGKGGLAPFNPVAGVAIVPSFDRANLRAMVERAASEAGVDPQLLDAMAQAESGYDPSAVSHAGAQGLLQLMPKTAASLGVRNPFDPMQNARGAARYLAQLQTQFGDVRLAVAAYNAGPGAVRSAGNRIPQFPETLRYVDKVMSLYEGGRP